MTIDEAIKILSESAYGGMTSFDEKYKNAQKLGIEALHRVRKIRSLTLSLACLPLPGETNE